MQAAHAGAVEKDRQAEQAFTEKGRKLPPPTAPAAEAAVEQARRELELLERQLPTSTDRLSSCQHRPSSIRFRRLRRLLQGVHGVRVSSPARCWTLRSSATDDADSLCCERRTMRTTWRMPPQAQGAADGPSKPVGVPLECRTSHRPFLR